MLATRLAWRSLARHRRRTIISGVAVALGLAMFLVFVGISRDSHSQMIELGVRMGAGHVLVQGRGYQEQQSIDYVVEDIETVQSRVQDAVPGALTAPRIRGGGLVSAGERSVGVAVAGVDPEREPRVSSIDEPRRLRAGRYLSAWDPQSPRPADAYLGEELAKRLDVTIGDRLLLTVSARGASRPSSAAFTVAGIFRTGVDELDGFYVEVPLTAAQGLFHLPGAGTQLAIILPDREQTDRITARLRAILAGDELEVLPWTEALRELYDALVLDDISMYVLMVIVFIIVAIGIFNTVFMSVIERTKELGVIAALGTSPRFLLKLVFVEALILAIGSVIVGSLLAYGLHLWIASVGIDIASLYGAEIEMVGIVFEGRIRSELPFAVIAEAAIGVAALVVAAAIYPAVRAARLDPVEAMRHV